jgi:outer membrane lipoprotein SlyB
MKRAVFVGLLAASTFLATNADPQSTRDADSRHYQKKQTKKKSAERIGVGAAAGAAVGAIAGRGKGAAIGAGAGAGAGALYDHHEKSKAKEKDAYRSSYDERTSKHRDDRSR